MSVFDILRRSCTSCRDTNRRHFSKVGFVGLGNMGNKMARNLLKKGCDLTVYDINKSAMLSLVEAGAKDAVNLREVAKNSQVIISMLPSNQHVLDCYINENGLLSSVRENALLIESSTIDPSVSKIVSNEAMKKNAYFVDGPVSGGVNAAHNGTLTFTLIFDVNKNGSKFLQMLVLPHKILSIFF